MATIRPPAAISPLAKLPLARLIRAYDFMRGGAGEPETSKLEPEKQGGIGGP